MEYEDLDLPSLSDLKGSALLHMIDFHIATNAPKVGMPGYGYPEAPDDIGTDGDPSNPITQRSINMKSKRYCAEKFIGSLVDTLRDLEVSPTIINSYLERIANNETLPDHVVDAAIRFQDILVESTPDLKEDRDYIQAEYRHLIHPKP